MKKRVPRVHAVTDNSVIELPDFPDRARALAVGPDTALHIRSGTLSGKRLAEHAEQAVAAGRPTGTIVLVNDRADVALAVGADGIHLPAAGLPVAVARSLLGNDALIGRSTHSIDEARAAADAGADYVFLGPIWQTRSHPDREPLGPAVLSLLQSIPVIAIGGVEPERVPTVIDSGAHGVAAITSLWHASDPRAAVESMLLSFDA